MASEIKDPTRGDRPERREQPRKLLAELDQRTWHLWALSIAVSLSLALGIVCIFFPAIKWGIVRIEIRYFESLPQLVFGLLTLVSLSGFYFITRQRELNEMRNTLISFYADAPRWATPYPRDSLTGVLDRRALPDVLKLEGIRADRYRSQFCMVLCDVCEFHKINAHEGNLAGDLVLMDLARALQATARKTDAVIRYGPDQFLCMLPTADRSGGEAFIQRVGQAVEGSRRLRKLTLVFGFADYRTGMSLDGVLVEAEGDLEAQKIKKSAAAERGARPS